MNYCSKIHPGDPFPEDLTTLDETAIEVLNSRVHRALDAEYLSLDGPNPETTFRQEEVTIELDRRDKAMQTGARKLLRLRPA
ncbi:hypothetical protein [uncultured Arthrobacter sp.]|uniref:hypothetical protein n=1 Tax=uncultured Arthrobacter sp. TaxID=114050 RepID=UPI002635238F|nr:hypothetical protein [uncultured Arthrobacter sp.]